MDLLGAFHLPLSSSRRLMRVLGAIVQSLVLAMLAAEPQLPSGRAIGFQLIQNVVAIQLVSSG